MAKGRHNHFNYDNVYVGRGTPNRVTMWTALSGADLGGGPLVIGLGSNRHRRLIKTYGATDMDRDLTDAVFTQDPREMVEDSGFKLATTRYQPGDAIIFGMFMLHSTAPNLSDRYRISSTRATNRKTKPPTSASSSARTAPGSATSTTRAPRTNRCPSCVRSGGSDVEGAADRLLGAPAS